MIQVTDITFILTPSPSSNCSPIPYTPTAAFYTDPTGDLETADLVLAGEDPFLGEDADSADDSKPVRVLTDFVLYDPTHRGEVLSLSAIEEDDGVDRQFEAAGVAFPYVANEEDEGQEDDGGGGGVDADEVKKLKLGAVLRYSFNYTLPNEYVLVFLFPVPMCVLIVVCIFKSGVY